MTVSHELMLMIQEAANKNRIMIAFSRLFFFAFEILDKINEI